MLGIHGAVRCFEDGGIFALRAVVARKGVAVEAAADCCGAAAGDDLRACGVVYINGNGEAGLALFAGREEGQELYGCGYLFEHVGGFLDFFWLWDESDGVGHGEDLHLREKLGGEVGETLRVESAGAGLG